MKNKIIIVPVVLLIAVLFGFSNKTNNDFVRKTNSSHFVEIQQSKDTVKPKDTIVEAPLKTKLFKKNVEASHYSDKLNGRKTASGQVFSNKKYTAAHKSLKFGTKVKITNVVNNKSVVVTINDRGPYTKHREIDMAKKPFMDISHNNGRAPLRVNIEIIE